MGTYVLVHGARHTGKSSNPSPPSSQRRALADGLVAKIHRPPGPGFPELQRDLFGSSEKFMACRSTPGFPELREQLEIMRPGTVRQSVQQYLIEGLELFGVHRCPLARTP
jgi:hypothetical protein